MTGCGNKGPVTQPGKSMRGNSDPCVSDRTDPSTAENLLLPSVDEFPHPGKAGAKSQVSLRARQIRIRNSYRKSGMTGKTDRAGSLACAGPGLEPFPRTKPNKVGESVTLAVATQGFPGFRARRLGL